MNQKIENKPDAPENGCLGSLKCVLGFFEHLNWISHSFVSGNS